MKLTSLTKFTWSNLSQKVEYIYQMALATKLESIDKILGEETKRDLKEREAKLVLKRNKTWKDLVTKVPAIRKR